MCSSLGLCGRVLLENIPEAFLVPLLQARGKNMWPSDASSLRRRVSSVSRQKDITDYNHRDVKFEVGGLGDGSVKWSVSTNNKK